MLRNNWLIFLILLFIGFFTVGYVLHLSPFDYTYYKKLTSDQKGETPNMASHHERKHVCKEIWYHDNSLLHCYIESQHSDLFFFSGENKSEIIEELDEVQCSLQEELYYLLPDGKEAISLSNGTLVLRDSPTTPVTFALNDLKPMQCVHRIVAKKAYYNYTTQVFFAEDVLIWKYRLPGHELVKIFDSTSPLMQGTAQSIRFALKEEKLTFEAEQLQAEWKQEVPFSI